MNKLQQLISSVLALISICGITMSIGLFAMGWINIIKELYASTRGEPLTPWILLVCSALVMLSAKMVAEA